MRPIEQVINDVEDLKEKPLPFAVGFEVIMYLEMLHDLMCDTSHYFFRYAGDNLRPRNVPDWSGDEARSN